jgi:hypothetical protein
MNLTEACNLAALIHSDDRFLVIAIGRFLLIDELALAGADERPWGLTVMPRDMPTRRVTLWSPELWTEYRTLVLEEMAGPIVAKPVDEPVGRPSQAVAEQAPERPRKAVLQPAAVKVSPTEEQILLFD